MGVTMVFTELGCFVYIMQSIWQIAPQRTSAYKSASSRNHNTQILAHLVSIESKDYQELRKSKTRPVGLKKTAVKREMKTYNLSNWS